MNSEIAQRADFSQIRYGQCWEDADVLLSGLEVRPGDVCLSIASAGDNALALLSQDPQRVIAIDMNPAQLACLELRVAAYRELTHGELLELMGTSPSERRSSLYGRCRHHLSVPVQSFWEAHASLIEAGIGHAGKFERYFSLFRRRLIPLIHGKKCLDDLLRPKDRSERERYYDDHWNNYRWKFLFRLFCSRWVMGRLGRDPRFFDYVEGGVAAPILKRVEHALRVLDPSQNPYLQWIVKGRFETALPFALRPENFDAIRSRLDRLEWHCVALEEFLKAPDSPVIDRYNLSDIFEYMSFESYTNLLQTIVRKGRRGSRIAYWNMLAPRSRPEEMRALLRPLEDLASRLHQEDKAFFYSRFVIEEVL